MKHKFSINTSSSSTNDGLFINSQNQSLYSVILSSFSLKFVKMPIPFSRGDHFLILSFLWHLSPPLVRLRRITWMLVPSGPIRTHLEVAESVESCEVTIQVFFPHKCGQLSWCRVLNVEVMVTFYRYFLFSLFAHL